MFSIKFMLRIKTQNSRFWRLEDKVRFGVSLKIGPETHGCDEIDSVPRSYTIHIQRIYNT